MIRLLIPLMMILPLGVSAQRLSIDDDWHFAFGHAADPQKDFGCGTEYFNYLTKANSIHNEGPYSRKFVEKERPVLGSSAAESSERPVLGLTMPESQTWRKVNLPHDWVVDLPFAPEASHSHGYKTVGWKYPETSVGWYRKWLVFNPEDAGRKAYITFDGIFRDSRVWVNGFYCGGEQSGYISQTYDITDYISHKNLREGRQDSVLVCVRVDASLEEGWFYEGAGIYRHAWLDKGELPEKLDKGELPEKLDKGELPESVASRPRYKVEFDKDKGLFIDGKHVKLKGACLHQDHAGVGAAIPDELYVWRVKKLKEFGFNAIRTSHNPASPALLDICDSLGMFVIEENRLLGTSEYQKRQLKSMIERDKHHPCIIAWSMGNEEWGVEWNEFGEQIVRSMSDYAHQLDPTRPTTVATSSGPEPIKGADLAGYNYVTQNPIDELRQQYPNRIAYCSEETSGCGTRGVYFKEDDDRNPKNPKNPKNPRTPTNPKNPKTPKTPKASAAMPALNREPDKDGTINRIARGWKFQDERPWMCGLFYWTGFDYRGEPNPLAYPATGSEFGIFDYCGFPKDEAYYLKSWWTDEPVLHLLPHWNLQGHEGEEIDVWAYSNCDEVELFVNGKSLGRKQMEKNGHLSWKAVYRPGKLKAIGYKNKKKILTETIETTGAAVSLKTSEERIGKLSVLTIEARDAKGRFVPDANIPFTVQALGGTTILGGGNGDPSWREKERPSDGENSLTLTTFNGLAQILLTTAEGEEAGFEIKIKEE